MQRRRVVCRYYGFWGVVGSLRLQYSSNPGPSEGYFACRRGTAGRYSGFTCWRFCSISDSSTSLTLRFELGQRPGTLCFGPSLDEPAPAIQPVVSVLYRRGRNILVSADLRQVGSDRGQNCSEPTKRYFHRQHEGQEGSS